MRIRCVVVVAGKLQPDGTVYTQEALLYAASKYNRAHKDIDDSCMVVDDGALTYCGEEPCQEDTILHELGMVE